MNALSQLLYLGWWFFRARFLGRQKPLQSVVFVTNGCNSTCRHCTNCTKAEGIHFKPFDDISKDLDECYSQGARMLDIEGVNLLYWHDGEHQVNEIFQLAKAKGFYSTSTMIPAPLYEGWKSLGTHVDVLWVSVMGLEDCRLLENMNEMSLYMVVNSQNHHELPSVLEFVQQHPVIKQIAFNFHTPFSGSEHLALSKVLREEVINLLVESKKKGYRIMNSISGLRNMLTLRFKRHCWICNFIYCDGRRSPQCIDDKASGVCERCGFSMAGEMNAVFNMRPDTILAGIGIRL
ncbi:MAG: radical SAM protein [Bacteroidaceae bacterium]|nr:radical SAM protein [Bacteroidaceae bacterium]